MRAFAKLDVINPKTVAKWKGGPRRAIAKGRSGYVPGPAATGDANRQRGRFALPVASAPAPIAAQLGTDAPLVKLSAADGAKQAENHKDLTPQDYARIQEALDVATHVVPEPVRRQLHVFADLVTRSVKVVLRKAARTGELFLKSFHFIDHGSAAERAARKARAVAGGG